MRNIFLILLGILFCPILFSTEAFCQTGSIITQVKDSSGAAVSGAKLIIRNVATNNERTVQTDLAGTYQVLQLIPGEYEIRTEVEGFEPLTKKVFLDIGITAEVTFTLYASATTEIVEVSAANEIASRTRTESSTNVNNASIGSLPINRRNFLDFTLTSPRVVPDRVPGQGAAATSGLSFNGQPARQNNIKIDGFENNDSSNGSVRSTFSQDAVQEFQVISDSYSAEFGRALGGVVNIITKGGSNSFHTRLFGLIRNDEISARDAFTTDEPNYEQYQFGVTFGGPIKKDKAFFFTSFERLSIKQNRFVTITDQTVDALKRVGITGTTNGANPFAIGTTTTLARIDYTINPKNLFYFRYNGGFTFNGSFEPFGALISQTNSGVQNLRDNSVAFGNTYLGSSGLVNETRFIFSRREQVVSPVDNIGPQVQVVAPEGLVTTGQGTLLPQPKDDRIYQFVNNTSISKGRNQIRFGTDIYYLDSPEIEVPVFKGGFAFFSNIDLSPIATALGVQAPTPFSSLQLLDPSLRLPDQQSFLRTISPAFPVIFSGFPQGINLAEIPLPTSFSQGLGNPLGPTKAFFFSTYLQDDIKVTSKFITKLGLRYDINRLTALPDNSGNFSPRISFAYNPTEKINIKAAYGIFFAVPITGTSAVVKSFQQKSFGVLSLPFPFSAIAFSLPGRKLPTSGTFPPGIQPIPQLGLDFKYGNNLRSSYTQQAMFGIDYFIGKNTLISLSGAYVRGNKIFSQRYANPILRPIAGDPVTSAITGRLDPTQGFVFLFESAYDSYYYGTTASFNRRFGDKLGFNVSYTFSKALDNFIDIRNELLESNNPLQLNLERGLSLQDVRHRFVASSLVDIGMKNNPLLRNFQLSTIITLESGRPFNLLAGEDIDLSGDNPPGDRPLGIARNAGITPGFANVDLRLMRNFQFNERYSFQIFGEVFNAFNRVNISELNRTYPRVNGQFVLPPQENGRFLATRDRFRNAFSPRQFQMGFRFNF